MFDDQLFDFLGDEGEDLDVQLGGEFTPNGFTGPWVGEVLYSQGSQSEFSREDIGYDIKDEGGGWHWYFWKDPAAADIAREMLGAQYPAAAYWVWRIVTADVVNFSSEEARAKFGADIMYKARMTSFPKYRHEFGLIALPSAVAAYAPLQGWDVPDYSLDVLHGLTAESSEDDCLALIGGKNKNGHILPWEESVLGKQKIALWAALGEENIKAARPIGSLLPSGKPDPVSATSEKLNVCMRLAYREWPAPMWCQVIPVPDPRLDAVSAAGNRIHLPALTAIFPDKAAALASLGEEGGTVAVTSQAGTPPVPVIWKENTNLWQNQLSEIMEEVGSKPLPVIYGDMGGETALGCTVEELSVWIDYLKAQ